MTEQRPTYHADLAGLAATRRQQLTYAALNDAGAAEAGLLKLVAEIARLRDLLSLGTLDAVSYTHLTLPTNREV